MEGAEDKGVYSSEASGPSLADKYDYVMYGKIFKSELEKSGDMYSSYINANRAIYGSFGGLMLSLKGPMKNLSSFAVDTNVYILLKKL